MFDNFKFERKSSSRPGSTPNSRPGTSGEEEAIKKEKTEVTVKEVPLASPVALEAPQLDFEPKRSLSLTHHFADVFRRGSAASKATSGRSRDASPVRPGSSDRPTSSRGIKPRFWDSHNPDYESDGVPRKGSVASSHHSEGGDGTRKQSYVPRNAAGSFLKTASAAQTTKEKERLVSETGIAAQTGGRNHSSVTIGVSTTGNGHSVAMNINASGQRNASIGSTGRQPSLALSDISDNGSNLSTFSNGRRPSGVIPNNVASRYIKTKSITREDITKEEEEEPLEHTCGMGQPQAQAQTQGRRRPSARSRTGSSGTIKAVQLAPESYIQWQQSVSKAQALQGIPFVKPTGLGNLGDVREEGTSPSSARPKKPSVSIKVQPATPTKNSAPASPASSKKRPVLPKLDATRAAAEALADSVSPTNMNFSNSPTNTSSPTKSIASERRWRKVSAAGTSGSPTSKTSGSPTTRKASGGQAKKDAELEKLGFNGAVPA